MRKTLLSSLLVSLFLPSVSCDAGPRFADHFLDRTLRLDYTFCGNNREQHIFLDGLSQTQGWYGRRVNLDSLLLRGNGQIIVTDAARGDTLYRQSFSTLFQEWQTYEEATQVSRSFENTFLIPFPQRPVDVTVALFDTHNRECSRLTHRIQPSDILIRRSDVAAPTPWRYLRQSGDSHSCIDVAFVAEGYTAQEMPTFLKDCEETIEAILQHEPFRSEASRFNFLAVLSPSAQSGVSIPHDNLWLQTALGSHYDTFYSDRYLTTTRVRRLHDLLSGIPYEHIIILANTDNYGGGGIYNSYLLSAAHNAKSRPVAVHEFGHSFAGLADEYYNDDMFEALYPHDTEPWEPNITTLTDFASKWADLLPSDAAVPTVPDGKDLYTKVGLYEGGGYQSKGVYRPTQECRMKINEAPVFCPICQRAIRRIILFQTEE